MLPMHSIGAVDARSLNVGGSTCQRHWSIATTMLERHVTARAVARFGGRRLRLTAVIVMALRTVARSTVPASASAFNAAITMEIASTSKNRRSALRVSLRPEPSVPSVTKGCGMNARDVGRLMAELANPSGGNYKQLHIPIVFDKLEPTYDKITVGGKFVGTGNYTAYSANERTVITLSTVEQNLKIGDEVTLHWGETGGGAGKGKIEPTESFEVRGIISPTPFAKIVREEYISKRGH